MPTYGKRWLYFYIVGKSTNENFPSTKQFLLCITALRTNKIATASKPTDTRRANVLQQSPLLPRQVGLRWRRHPVRATRLASRDAGQANGAWDSPCLRAARRQAGWRSSHAILAGIGIVKGCGHPLTEKPGRSRANHYDFASLNK